MKRFSFYSLLLVALVFAVIACNKKDNTQCTFVAPKMVFVQFTPDELDTIILRKYAKDNSFSNQLDTSLLAKGGLTYTNIGQDSITISSDSVLYQTFINNFYLNDWEIYLPGAQYTARINDINCRFYTQTDKGESCKSFVLDLKLQGIKNTYTTWFGDDYRYYITKQN